MKRLGKVEVSLRDVNRAKRSIGGRIGRLRRHRWDKSPIAAIGVFDSQIDSMEGILIEMDNRLQSATVFI